MPGMVRLTFPQSAVVQKSIRAVTGTTLGAIFDDYTFLQLHTVPPDELELIVKTLFAQKAAMVLGPAPRIICIDFVDIHYHGCPHR
jgi:hypothetical protein